MRPTPRLAVLTLLAALALAAAGATPALAGPRVARSDAAAGVLALAVRANDEPADAAPGPSFAAGADVAWSYEVANTGTTHLWALYIWHEGVGAATCPDRSLEPGETVRCTASATARAGARAATVIAAAWDDAGVAVSGEATAWYSATAPVVLPLPALDLEASVATRDADAPPGPVITPGATATFRYRVRNTGNVTLWGLWVHDRVLGDIPCPTRTLAPGEQVICLAGPAAQEGAYASAVEAAASDAAGTVVSDADLLHYYGAYPAAAVNLETLVDGFDEDVPPGPRVGRPGETILFTYLVTNTGGVPLSGVRVRDTAGRAVACPGRSLASGESMVCTASAVAEIGAYSSIGTVTARRGSTVVQDSDPTYYHVRQEPRLHHLTLEVTVNGRQADEAPGPSLPMGRQAHFVYLITYDGNNVVYNVTIQDPFVPEAALTCDGDRQMTVGETLRCTADVPVAPGQYASQVTVISWDADGRRVTAEDRVHYYGMA